MRPPSPPPFTPYSVERRGRLRAADLDARDHYPRRRCHSAGSQLGSEVHDDIVLDAEVHSVGKPPEQSATDAGLDIVEAGHEGQQ
jgi:hypothetical protein